MLEVEIFELLVIGFAISVTMYAISIAALVLLGRRTDARALAGFIPDCLVLVKRLLEDRRLPRRHKLLLVGLAAYLAMPVDLVPDFIPVAGQLDDAILVALALRVVFRSAGERLLDEHWPGPTESLRVVHRLAFGRAVSRRIHGRGLEGRRGSSDSP